MKNKLQFTEIVEVMTGRGRVPVKALPSPSPYLAVTMPVDGGTGYVNVTHIPSGMRVGEASTRTKGRYIVRVLLGLPIDWSQDGKVVGLAVRDLGWVLPWLQKIGWS